jgi:UMF1 family MFS transporter
VYGRGEDVERPKATNTRFKTNFLIISWALYDLANQFFALNIVSLYFVRWLVFKKGLPEIFYSVSFGISMFLVAVLAPFLGFVSDFLRRYRIFLVHFTLLSVIFTLLLAVTKNAFCALLFFIIANFGCQMAVVFYNALMVNIAAKNKLGLISGIGRMFAYCGAIVSLYFIKPIVLKYGYRATFLPTALLFLLFSLPCMIFVKDRLPQGKRGLVQFLKRYGISRILRALKRAVSKTYQIRGISNFLKSVFFGLCAVNAVVVFMSVYATQVFGLTESQIINLIAFGTLFAIAGSIISGLVSDYLGYKRSLLLVFVLWVFCFILGALAKGVANFFLIGALVGLTLGSTMVVARALAISLVPQDKVGKVFGLFNLIGYASSIVGVLFWGLILALLSSWAQIGYRIALLSLNIFMFLGIFFLWRIPTKTKYV